MGNGNPFSPAVNFGALVDMPKSYQNNGFSEGLPKGTDGTIDFTAASQMLKPLPRPAQAWPGARVPGLTGAGNGVPGLAGAGGRPTPSPAMLDSLREHANDQLAIRAFEKYYGPGSAQRYLATGGGKPAGIV